MTTRTYSVLDTAIGDTILPLFTSTAAPVNGTSGTLANVAPASAVLLYNGTTYQNTGTLASPIWSAGPSGASVAITGGTINATPIGGSTPAAAAVTTLHATGTSVLDGAVSGDGFVAAVQAIAGAGQVITSKQTSRAPLPADLVSVVNAVTPSNVALTLAAQPVRARKLQVRVVIGTSPTTAITAGNLAIVGVDQDGNATTENISLITTTSATIKSAHAYASITSATVSAYAASGSGTGNTIGIGVSNDIGISTGHGVVSGFTLIKSTKITTAWTPGTPAWSVVAADDVAGSATVDATARTVAPTTAPDANGLIDYEFTVNYTLAA
jgi:hypothetical protein